MFRRHITALLLIAKYARLLLSMLWWAFPENTFSERVSLPLVAQCIGSVLQQMFVGWWRLLHPCTTSGGKHQWVQHRPGYCVGLVNHDSL